MAVRFSRRFHWSGFILGFGLSGFFDGILLHQVLQWHHLLLGVEGEAYRDIRVQILADGLFHILMYLVTAIGLYLLWQVRREFTEDSAGRKLFANVLIGFGVWNFVDVISAHWVLGIHRVRMVDTDNPLLWDFIWLAAFGAVPLLIGLWLRRDRPASGIRRGHLAASLLAITVVGSGIWAAMPPRDVSQVMVWFGPNASSQHVMLAAAAVDARILWADRSGQLWAFALPDPSLSSRLYRQGAWFVGNSILSAGCLSWSRATRPAAQI
jgi:uncharacterized membrane protein